jgi:hypothetical protein
MKIRLIIFMSVFSILLNLFSGDIAFAKNGKPPKPHKPPPWVDPNPIDPNPPAAPEPVSLILIGMGASGAIGYYLGKKKKK